MDRAIITFHMPTHRQTALKLQGNTLDAEYAYDGSIGDYLRFLEQEAAKAGIRIRTDQQAYGPVFTIEGRNHDEDKAAHAWLEGQPDIWNWIPAVPPEMMPGA